MITPKWRGLPLSNLFSEVSVMSCPSSSLPSSIQPASSTQRTVSYILPGSSTQPTVSYILPGSPPPLSPPSPFPSSYLGTVTAPASRPHLSSHLIGPPSEPLPPASPASQAFKHRFSFQKLAAPEPSKAARQSPPLALRTADLAAVDQRDPRTVTKALERAIQQRLEERARGESAQARAKDDVRSLVERLLSGRPPPNEERSSILSACVQACELGGLNLSTVLQELTIDGCPPIYWAIVNRAAASGSDNVELDSIVFALLDACRPLRPVTLDAIRRACMRASDNVLLQRLFLDIPLLSPLSAGDMILLGKNLKDHVDVDEKRDGTGSFVAYIKIPKFPLRMRLCHSVTIQFVASCRLWILRFNAVVETAATKGQPESKWYLSLELGQNSPPTTVNASLIAGPSNPAENRGPDPARTVSFGCNTPELSPGRLLRVRLDECPIGPHLLSGSSLFVGSNKTFHAELSQSQRPQLLADTLITSVSSSPQLVIPTPELLQSLPLPPTPKKKRSSPPHTTLRRGGRIGNTRVRFYS
ncbi:hypothetical protein BGW80DRAFT_917005 [Lactifluus volemus]|nr:hypothetical protein BGW80DRAFT_917005 [Lactifluus volemus]